MESWGFHGGTPIDLDPDGSVTAPDGRKYRRTPERLKRANGHAAIDSGARLMTDIYPDGPYLFEGDDACAAWRQILPTLVVGQIKGEQGVIWKGHIWSADDGSRLLQVRGYH